MFKDPNRSQWTLLYIIINLVFCFVFVFRKLQKGYRKRKSFVWDTGAVTKIKMEEVKYSSVTTKVCFNEMMWCLSSLLGTWAAHKQAHILCSHWQYFCCAIDLHFCIEKWFLIEIHWVVKSNLHDEGAVSFTLTLNPTPIQL